MYLNCDDQGRGNEKEKRQQGVQTLFFKSQCIKPFSLSLMLLDQ